MDLRTIIVILVRRWYVALPIALIALVVAAGSGGSPTWSVDTSFLLITPATAIEEAEASNPIIDTPAGVNAAANVAAVVLESEDSRRQVAEAGYAASYGFSVARNDPFVTLEVTHSDPDVASITAEALTDVFVLEIAQQQLRYGADSNVLVSAVRLEQSEPEADYSAVRTSQAMVAVVGLVLAFLAAFAVEGVIYFFSDRRRDFHAFDQYESDVALHGVGGESAAEFRPTGSEQPHLRAAPAPPEPPRSDRWTRPDRSRPGDD